MSNTTTTTYRLRYADSSDRILYLRRYGRSAYGSINWSLTETSTLATEWRTLAAAERVAAEVASHLHSFNVEAVTA
jgi:hypothetical protein